MDTEPVLRNHFLIYVRSFLLQTAQTALANGRYTRPVDVLSGPYAVQRGSHCFLPTPEAELESQGVPPPSL